MKKILMVLMGLETGGAETHVVELSLTLQSRGWEVLVASNGGVYEKVLEEHGIRHFLVPAHTREPRMMRRAYLALEQVIRREKPDVVHAHARIPAFLCGLLHRKMGFPFVTTAHWVFRVNPILRLITDWGQQTIAVSEDIREYLIRCYDLPASQIHTTINGIDTALFSPEVSGKASRQEFGIPADVPVVTCVTRLHESRALSATLLVHCAPKLAATNPGLRILVVGDGERLSWLTRQANAVNQRLGYPCVILTGGRTDVPQLVAACDVFVGVSRAALEAMSSEKPVLLCGNEGYGGLAREETAAENLTSNYCCRGNQAATAETLTEDIQKLLAMTAQQRREIGKAGRRIVERDFSLDTMARDCEHAYELAMHPKRQVVVSGYYGYENLGDETILGTICSRYREQYDLVVLSKQPHQTERKFGVTAISRFNVLKVHRAIRKCSMLISGGGSLLQDRTSTRSLLYYLSVMHMAQRLKKPVMVYANGIGPVRGKWNRRLVVRVLQKAAAITLRDEDSLRELQNMGLSRQDILVTADPVFSMHTTEPGLAKQLWDQMGVPQNAKVLGISLRTHSQNAAERLAKLFDGICQDTGYVPVFLCMQAAEDMQGAEGVMKLMQTKAYLLPGQLGAREMMSALEHMELVISMRLHTLIFAATVGTPVMGFDYDPKVNSLLRKLNMPSLGAVQELDVQQGRALVAEFAAQPETYRQKIKAAAQALREQEKENDRILTELLPREPSEGTPKKRIAIFQSDLHVGGIQKSLVNLMSQEMMDNYEVDVYLFDQKVFFDMSEIRPHIRLHHLKPFPYLFRVVPFALIYHCMPRFHFALEKPYDVAIDFSNYQQDCAFGALTVPAKKRVMWIHNDMEIKYREEWRYRVLWVFFKNKFHRFDEFVAVSDGIIQPFRNKTGMRDAKVTAIPNLINTAEIFEKCEMPIDFEVDPKKVNIASMGHLNHQKGYDIMLDQLKPVCQRRKDLALYIFGDGKEHAALVEQAKQNGLEDVVHFMGYQPNPYPYLNRLDAFYLESRYEGQGMVLWEAKALGLPLIFPKRLEKYNMSLTGTDDIYDTLLHLQKTEKEKDDLHTYNQEIIRRLRQVIDSE